MTVMFKLFYGVPQSFYRSDYGRRVKGCALGLYNYLLYESERTCSRELTISDQALIREMGGNHASWGRARKTLQQVGLVKLEQSPGMQIKYTLCDPETREPVPGDPKTPVLYKRKGSRSNAISTGHAGSPQHSGDVSVSKPSPAMIQRTTIGHKGEKKNSEAATDFRYGCNEIIMQSEADSRIVDASEYNPFLRR
jgi:hypothetical protein